MRGLVLIPAAMIALATVSSATLLWDEIFRYVHRTPHLVGIPDTAVKNLRSIVPKGETLGFVSDRSGPDFGTRLFGMTYSLAPLIVENTANRRLVIGDFRSQSSIPIALNRYRVHIVKNLGNGFLLLAAQ